MVLKYSLIAFLAFISLIAFDEQPMLTESKLILFVDSDNPIINFDEIEVIKSLSAELKSEFVMVESNTGLPDEVHTLPAIYFQDENGRSKYYGRYNNKSRIKNFVRTSKMVHQRNDSSPKTEVLVWQSGKADIVLPIKITTLSGMGAKDSDQINFEQEVKKALAQGMTNFDLKLSHDLTKNSRSFHLNVYPYLNEINELSLTGELFSQFNCVKPIYSAFNTPLVTEPWERRGKAIAEFGALMETEILSQIATSKSGDAFTIVDKDQKNVSWGDLDLEVIERGNNVKETKVLNKALPLEWQVSQDRNNDDPIIIFSFLSPVDNYAGEVKKLSGDLSFDKGHALAKARGKFNVDISEVTMGSADFDFEVQNKMLKMGLFPKAHFEFSDLESSISNLRFNTPTDFKTTGRFTMMGIATDLKVDGRMLSFLDENENLRLEVNCSFELPLFDIFKVEGPDGPSPAKDRLQFFMKFYLEPK